MLLFESTEVKKTKKKNINFTDAPEWDYVR